MLLNSEVKVVMSLRKHLATLEAIEYAKPPLQRRHVPTLAELADVSGITRQGFYAFAKEGAQLVNLNILSVVIAELRRHGFETEVGDLLVIYPANLV